LPLPCHREGYPAELGFKAPAIAIGAIVKVRAKLLDLAAKVPEMVA
jgi:hypothetical protein